MTVPCGSAYLSGCAGVVRYAVAGQVDVRPGRVVQLDPVAVAPVRAEQRGGVGRHELVDEHAVALRLGGGERGEERGDALVVVGKAGARAHLDPAARLVAAERIARGHRLEREAVDHRAALGGEHEVVVRGELEGRVQRPARRIARAEHDQVPVRRDRRAGREGPLGRLHLVVGEAVAADGHLLVGIVVQLQPVGRVARLVGQGALIAGHDLVDADGMRIQAPGRTASGEVDDQRRQQDDRQRHDQYQAPASQWFNSPFPPVGGGPSWVGGRPPARGPFPAGGCARAVKRRTAQYRASPSFPDALPLP